MPKAPHGDKELRRVERLADALGLGSPKPREASCQRRLVMQPDRAERIQRRAHAIWEREGRPEGRQDEHWQQAREEIERQERGALAEAPLLDEPPSGALKAGA